MKWEKLGQIFVFDRTPLKDRYISHAQSPQALLLEDRIRVFFSTRTVDEPGKFLSHVRYVDYDPDFKRVINYSEHEVIPLGELGCFDEHGIFPSRRASVAVETGIGFATSSDNGKTFQKLGNGPIVSASTHEPFMVGDPFVRIFSSKFHMFYIFGTKWSEATAEHPSERVYKIGHAVSDDGINWIKTNRHTIADKIDEDECQALPTVIKIGKRYHMYFCYRHMTGFRKEKGKGYRLGYAYSEDLVTWTRDDRNAGINLSDKGWDSDMMCYPNIFECKSGIYLLYNGNEFGRTGFGAAKLIS
jgi:hypothetical protein